MASKQAQASDRLLEDAQQVQQPAQLPDVITQAAVSLGQVPGPDGRMRVVLNVQTTFLLTPAGARQMGVQLQQLGSAGELAVIGGDGKAGRG